MQLRKEREIEEEGGALRLYLVNNTLHHLLISMGQAGQPDL